MEKCCRTPHGRLDARQTFSCINPTLLSNSSTLAAILGIIFVYDMSNIRSYNNLRKWIAELSLAQKNRPNVVANPDNIGPLPTIVIGNKQDAIQTQRMAPLRDLKMDSLEASALEGRLDMSRFHLFLDRVVATAFTSTPRQPSGHGIMRSRFIASSSPHGTTPTSSTSSWWS
ncbi:hypothetical protein, variant [Aphanomyces invadans]|uniref:Uncharacterized protein n=1 Tax=Aphanomyces invadans TaxID=157072 RepID=A0A024U7W3_9STRA|nr:hypothetical protein, variant [Aphanomyces invadans]ETW02349.1 hypothetical protein, variant [Aphanomyces invadans]|eukprot:XP_008868954.1 hypothetical protein, variant [Aphanomyces invadans]